ncbi:MAG TPA: hypothetical protein VGZ47_15225, partial [Gemmataceae bacterium]|nr:hypothetical protein [Gemmataceae bacterium]
RQLERLRDIALAFGLSGESDRAKSLLLGESTALRIEQFPARLAMLKETYPDIENWSLADVPDAASAEIRTLAQNSYSNLLPAGQQAVLRELPRNDEEKETPARWLELAAWASTSTELKQWQALAMIFLRLAESKPEEPAQTLAKFLRTTEFPLRLSTVRLQIPDDLKTNLQPAGKLSVFLKAGDSTQTLTFRKDREEHDPRGRLTSYDFVPEGAASLTFHPGETLWAELPLRDASNAAWKLTWSQCRSRVYQFERLIRPPRLHRENQDSAKGELVEGARLLIPDYPHVPDLLPVVK